MRFTFKSSFLLSFLMMLAILMLYTNVSDLSVNMRCYSPNLDVFATYQDHWQNVTPAGLHYVYSAFVDGSDVRIIGASRKLNDTSLFCHMWSHNDSKTGSTVSKHVGNVRLAGIKESHDKRYTAAYFICKIRQHSTPFAVSVTPWPDTNKCRDLPNMMAIRKPNTNYKIKNNFSACVSPFNKNYSEAKGLIEWIELNRIMGVEHFTFYNYSMAKNVTEVIELYMQKGLIDLLPWQPPMLVSLGNPDQRVSEEEIHYYGQLAAQNDCLYRNRGSSEFVVFIDLDEFIVPHKAGVIHWSDMIKDLPKKCGFIFRNSFFRKEFQDDDSVYTGSEFVKKHSLLTMLKLEREDFVWVPRKRSKVMVRPNNIVTIGIHHVWQPLRCEHVVDPSVGLLHHYRHYKRKDSIIDKVPDNNMLKYRRELIRNVNKTICLLGMN